jgi:hypothetical protein
LPLPLHPAKAKTRTLRSVVKRTRFIGPPKFLKYSVGINEGGSNRLLRARDNRHANGARKLFMPFHGYMYKTPRPKWRSGNALINKF